MVSENGFIILEMTGTDVQVAVDWAAEEGWNPGLNDAQCFFRTDLSGFSSGS